jgi:hypothetical protein
MAAAIFGSMLAFPEIRVPGRRTAPQNAADWHAGPARITAVLAASRIRDCLMLPPIQIDGSARVTFLPSG